MIEENMAYIIGQKLVIWNKSLSVFLDEYRMFMDFQGEIHLNDALTNFPSIYRSYYFQNSVVEDNEFLTFH